MARITEHVACGRAAHRFRFPEALRVGPFASRSPDGRLELPLIRFFLPLLACLVDAHRTELLSLKVATLTNVPNATHQRLLFCHVRDVASPGHLNFMNSSSQLTVARVEVICGLCNAFRERGRVCDFLGQRFPWLNTKWFQSPPAPCRTRRGALFPP